MSEKKTKIYCQRFREEWINNELFCDWLEEVKGDPKSAYCKACKSILKGKFSVLISHRKGKKHVKRLELFKSSIQGSRVVRNFNENEMKKSKSHFPKDETPSSPLRQFDSENYEVEIGRNSDLEDDSVLSSHNKSFSQEPKRNTRETKHKYLFKKDLYSHDDPELNMMYPELVFSSSEKSPEHEVDAFGKSITAQMRNLPEEKFVRLTAEIQTLVTQARIEYIEEQKAPKNVPDASVISFSYKMPDSNSDLQSDQITTINNVQL